MESKLIAEEKIAIIKENKRLYILQFICLVYFLSNYVILWNGPDGRKRTYNGMTNNIERRFRQHNCELVGGARATSSMIKKYPDSFWKPIIIIEGFPDKREAMKAEWRIRWPDKKRNKSKKFKLDTGAFVIGVLTMPLFIFFGLPLVLLFINRKNFRKSLTWGWLAGLVLVILLFVAIESVQYGGLLIY